MKTFLGILLLVNYLSVNFATQDVNDKKLTSDELTNDNTLDSSDLFNNDNNSAGHSNTEEGLDSQIEGADSNSDDYDEDTDIEDSDYGIKKMFDILEEEIYKRLAAIEKSFEDEENESDALSSKTESSASDMNENVTQNTESESAFEKTEIINSDIESDANKTVINSSENIENSEINTKNSITENKTSGTESQIKSIQNSEIETSKMVLDSAETIENSESKTQSKYTDSKSSNTFENIDKTRSTTGDDNKDNKNTKSNVQNLNVHKMENLPADDKSITDLDNIEGEAEDFDMDNYYDELLNSDLGDVETLKDFIGDDEDAYSVVDITLPSDTQFEMTKYEKVQNGRKVVLMKLVPVGSAADEDQSTNDKLTSNNIEAINKKKSLLIPVTNTVHKETPSNKDFDINEKSTKAQNKTLISTDISNECSSLISSDKVIDDTKENSKSRTTRNSKVIYDKNIAEDVDDSSTTVGSKNISKSLAAEDDGAKWCICYSKLSDIPWVVRMQMGV